MLTRPVTARASSPFGYRFGGADWHGGVDFAAPLGSPVRAAHAGTVLNVFPNGAMNKYGNTVVVQHTLPADAPYALYAHLSSYNVKKGDRVAEGQVIARSGNTAGTDSDPGHTFAPHLHFELLSKWPPQYPDQYRVDPTRALGIEDEMPSNTGLGIGSVAVAVGVWWWLRQRQQGRRRRR